MTPIDPYRDAIGIVEHKRRQDYMAGPPDLKKKYVKEPQGKKKKQAAPEQEQYSDEDQLPSPDGDEVQEFQEDEGYPGGAPPGYQPPPPQYQQQYQPQYQPPQQQYQPPPQQQQQQAQEEQPYDISRQVYELGVLVYQMQKYLGTFRQYLMFQKKLLEKESDLQARAPAPARAPPVSEGAPMQTPIQTLAQDPALTAKAAKFNSVMKFGAAFIFVGLGGYILYMMEMAPITVIAIILIAIGGGFLSSLIIK